MKKKFIIIYILVIIVTLFFLPISLGKWSQSVYINGTVIITETSPDASNDDNEYDLATENNLTQGAEVLDDSYVPDNEGNTHTGAEISTSQELSKDIDQDTITENPDAATTQLNGDSEGTGKVENDDEIRWSETDVEKSGE
ncbi:MAG: hypothetical protein GX257_07015 [Clostridiales bacterium]|jgi:hypothetical protein|nr:hypothetical protein [Clostridiales bacterium]